MAIYRQKVPFTASLTAFKRQQLHAGQNMFAYRVRTALPARRAGRAVRESMLEGGLVDKS